jgi:DNA-binding transcriptional MerR regulator
MGAVTQGGFSVTVYLLGDLIREARISEDTIGRWCRMGLLRPSRDSARRRLFSQHDLDTAKRLARRTTPRLADAVEELADATGEQG